MPTLRQATGVRVALGFLYVETMVDPVHKHAHSGVGIAVTR
jgi:hypothetical protein